MKRPAGPAARTLFPTWSLRLLTEERGSCRRNDKRPVFNSLCKHRWVILEKRFIETLAVRQNLDCWSGMRHFHKPEAFLLLYNAPLFCFVYFTRKEVSKLTRSFQPAVRRLLLPWTYRRFSSGVVFFSFTIVSACCAESLFLCGAPFLNAHTIVLSGICFSVRQIGNCKKKGLPLAAKRPPPPHPSVFSVQTSTSESCTWRGEYFRNYCCVFHSVG